MGKIRDPSKNHQPNEWNHFKKVLRLAAYFLQNRFTWSMMTWSSIVLNAADGYYASQTIQNLTAKTIMQYLFSKEFQYSKQFHINWDFYKKSVSSSAKEELDLWVLQYLLLSIVLRSCDILIKLLLYGFIWRAIACKAVNTLHHLLSLSATRKRSKNILYTFAMVYCAIQKLAGPNFK